MKSELEDPIWAVGTQTEILGTDLTYDQAVGLVNQNLSRSGLAIISAEAAAEQIRLKERRDNRIT